MKTYISQQLNSRPRKIIGALALMLTIGISAVLVLGYRSSNNNQPATASSTGGGYNTVNYDPPTREDAEYNNRIKENLPSNNTVQSSSTQKSVTPVIVDANQYGDKVEVRSYVPGITENGGTCVITFIKGDITLSKDTPGVANAQSTTCTSVNLDRSFFPSSGTWSVTVNYQSTGGKGISRPSELQIK